ncbi:MAG: cyclopentanol dehydrogenase [Dehalococcoidia bacterium]|nr:cyclopentanol dehydrogenase [Dehalococcoidia bacterium]MQG15793.1 glucose 1-dehydrogenase [SAR202 cluster bacterium]|tara:strand:- start:10119 stop:10868 length:750 start_codon:yes stop_codon:yes gene_type:complete
MRLLNKVVVVTGATGGIGQAQCRLFAKERAKVVLADIDEQKGFKLANDISVAGGSALFVNLDVSSESDWDSLVKITIERFKKIDVLVNNAGIYRTESIQEENTADWDRLMSVNLKGAFLGTKAVVQSMRSNKVGSIINVSSTTALVGSWRGGAYGASKAALLSLTKHSSIQNAKYGIRVNAVVPGPIETEMISKNISDPEGRALSESRILLGRLGSPSEVAYAILYLASDDSRYVTGTELLVDGGLTAQ